MKTATLQFLISQPATSVYEVIADFPSYETFADAVRKVEIYNVKPGSCESFWEVKFRDGLLRWHERDAFFPEQGRILFSQTKGDLAVFDGSWQAQPHDECTTLLTFHAVLDLGLPQLASLLEPIAVQALRENITSIVNGLFEGHVHTAPVPSAAQMAVTSEDDRAVSAL
ncbi:polyketide cyclase/dehydrase/lipid transport protein [Tahibacter aquaticus]|uniref:Polyketide cyclase/dehydrase/lipid transport protein n=1 Tax=Tahibacter aquaticus TaxID=520092 RepID=A0A4R6Z232_9GAMM|nr:SRPBCC family protein [Tahibacter aquaticus]TDR45630.1 polyketide cyclase/dehydrase/lipid transport protein [Tahibacter aquaticus]